MTALVPSPGGLGALVARIEALQRRLAAGHKLTRAEEQQLRQAAAASARLRQVAHDTPLAVARLWRPHCTRWELQPDRPRGCGAEMVPVPDQPGVFTCATTGCEMHGVSEARTSQRDAIRRIARLATLLSGANRAGKTRSALMLGVATAGGSDEPWVRSWMTLNGIPDHVIQPEPGRVCVSALTHKDSLKYHRPALKEMLPRDTRLRKWTADDEAEAILSNGGRILLKAAKQGREAFQGDQYNLVVLDEEHPEEVFEEALRGTADRSGRMLLSMTPLKGITWPHKVFLGPGKWEGTSATRIFGLDNPWVKSRDLLERFKHLNEEKRRARLYGEWAAAKGLIWPQFRREVHVPDLPPKLDASWPRYRCLDFGINFACLWMALDPKTDTLIAYRELKTYDVALADNAARIHQMSGAERYRKTLADPAGAEERRQLQRKYKLPTTKARKNVEGGIDAVASRLALTNQKHVRLVISPECPELITEIEAYKRKDDGTVKKEHDHLCDVLRYICYDLEARKGMGAT